MDEIKLAPRRDRSVLPRSRRPACRRISAATDKTAPSSGSRTSGLPNHRCPQFPRLALVPSRFRILPWLIATLCGWHRAFGKRLSERARRAGMAERTLAQRYVEEGLRHDAHPLIQFIDGPSGQSAVRGGDASRDRWRSRQAAPGGGRARGRTSQDAPSRARRPSGPASRAGDGRWLRRLPASRPPGPRRHPLCAASDSSPAGSAFLRGAHVMRDRTGWSQSGQPALSRSTPYRFRTAASWPDRSSTSSALPPLSSAMSGKSVPHSVARAAV